MIMESKRKGGKEKRESPSSELWHACAGGLAHPPAMDSIVYYFPQGHQEHSFEKLRFMKNHWLPPYIPCRVLSVKHKADEVTDEVYAKIRLFPILEGSGAGDDVAEATSGGVTIHENKAFFVKTLTQSDANNGGGFSVPRYCADTILPKLDYSTKPPVQTIFVKDVHGKLWKFRHIYRGTPKRHLLTTGWSTFVNAKKLAAGDSIVFLKETSGQLRLGFRRRRGATGNPKVTAESVIAAVSRADARQPFSVLYYPRANRPAFCVNPFLVNRARQIGWTAGMRFKMAVETEDSTRVSWFMGTVSCVDVVDSNWPNSPWRILQVAWDEPNMLTDMGRVNPWSVELVSTLPHIHLPGLSYAGNMAGISFEGITIPFFSTDRSSSTGSCITSYCPSTGGGRTGNGIQGDRHASHHVTPLFPPPNLDWSISTPPVHGGDGIVFRFDGEAILRDEQQRSSCQRASNGSSEFESGGRRFSNTSDYGTSGPTDAILPLSLWF